ncbi:copper homeostasis periplasmic binding protein CopC [Pseudolabrys taiwanensis]|uniref:copper homeostasis periplasmic binding protein CopC n=1 Tax=Pseudolabrys taiwanensis TaxID=331696 RepID=UPI001AECA4EF|nr:copper homeostasis periplasmic binding protein CopC [Pseudolabrys taiwanensis]
MRSVSFALVCAGALMAPVAAFAHAHLDRSTPAAGTALKEPPPEVMLWFTEAVEPKFSSIEVRDAKGAAVQDGAAAAVPGNTAQLRVKLKPLAAGTYTVKWRVLSVDTHRSQGDFTFRVGP